MTPETPLMRTDKEILDWMEREGLESLVRCPQFNSEGESLGVCFWTSAWSPFLYFVSLRGAAMAAMQASEAPE